MGGTVVAPYGKAFDLMFPIFDRTGADIFAPTWQAGEARYSRETSPGTWTAIADAPLPTAHPTIANLNKLTLTAADMACRRLIIRLVDITGTKVWNDDTWEIQTKDHHLSFHRDPQLVHAGAVQAVGAQTFTLESPGPSDVPVGSLVHVSHAGLLTPKVRIAASFDPITRILTLDKVWGTNPTLPAEYMIYAGPEVPATVPADVISIQGDSGAATGLKYGGKAVIPTSIVAGVNTINQFTTALTAAPTNFYKPRAFIFFGGANDGHMGFVKAYAQIAGPKGLIDPETALPNPPSVGDVVVLF